VVNSPLTDKLVNVESRVAPSQVHFTTVWVNIVQLPSSCRWSSERIQYKREKKRIKSYFKSKRQGSLCIFKWP